MSTALAIAGVTAVLRDRLNDGLVNHNVAGLLGSSVTVSVRAPDRVIAADSTESSQLNLFLYQVLPNASWRNQALPAYDPSGQQRVSNPPLALDLYYLISAYSGGDLHAEILLGYAMQLMHEFPVITRAMLQTALTPSPDVGDSLPPALRALADCGLADQLEQLRITPQTLNTEESAKLWTATMSSFRPTAAYQVSVVLIEATRPALSPLPVLTRGEVDPVYHRERGVVVSANMIPPIPTLETIVPADEQPVAQLDSAVRLNGHHLDGSNREVRLGNSRFDVDELLTASGDNIDASMELIIPAARAADFPVGVYEASGQLVRPSETQVRETNRLGFTLAPNITNLPQSIARNGAGDVLVTITFTPQLRAGQRATLLVGQQEIAPQSLSAPTASLDFLIVAPAIGDYLVRLRIDGIDSPIVKRNSTPPTFLDRQLSVT
jgi:Pvc16 N-terminal domain